MQPIWVLKLTLLKYLKNQSTLMVFVILMYIYVKVFNSYLYKIVLNFLVLISNVYLAMYFIQVFHHKTSKTLMGLLLRTATSMAYTLSIMFMVLSKFYLQTYIKNCLKLSIWAKFKSGMASHAPFNPWDDGHKILLSFVT